MRKYRKIVLLFTLAVFINICCRKADYPTTDMETSLNIETKFFSSHTSGDPLVQGIQRFVQGENDKLHFAETLVKRIGYPVWDKSLITGKNISSSNLLNTGASNVTFIPFVLPGQTSVNTSLAVITTETDTSFYFLQPSQYHDRIHGSPNVDSTAENLALLFMMLESGVNGYKRFKITDSTLFAGGPAASNGHEIHFDNPPVLSGRIGRSNMYAITLCTYWYICGSQTCVDRGYCDYMNCPTNECYLFGPPECETNEFNEPPVAGGGTVYSSGGGLINWVSVPIGGGGNSGLVPIPWEDEMISPCDKVAPLKTDTIFKNRVNDLKSKVTENKEYAYTMTSDGIMSSIYTGIPNECEVRVPVLGASQVLSLFLHVHNNSCPLPIFSPDDFLILNDLYTLGKTDSVFSLGLVTDSSVYLMVIDDIGAFVGFINTYFYEESPKDKERLIRNYQSYKINRTKSQEENEKLFLQFLKREGVGVKLLKANSDLSGYNEIKLNQTNERVSTPCN